MKRNKKILTLSDDNLECEDVLYSNRTQLANGLYLTSK
nr:MAG TPA: hypothetical protein [Caudoviricetes sp.]